MEKLIGEILSSTVVHLWLASVGVIGADQEQFSWHKHYDTERTMLFLMMLVQDP